MGEGAGGEGALRSPGLHPRHVSSRIEADAMPESTHFVVCIRNEGCEDLQLRKLYRVLPDESAARSAFLRIIDDSGGDYLYPVSHFRVV